MTQETELKLVLDAAQKETALGLCRQFSHGQEEDRLTLQNTYYDTPDLQLRQYDIGLRVRRSGTEAEQTVKLAGEVFGGMHSRPEYSLPAPEQGPDISLFDESIWPDDFPAFDIQRELTELFTTNFTRHRWRIPSGDGIIELVLDEGEVLVGDKKRQILEVELEVQGGLVADAYKLARRFITRAKARIGTLSKAARGYLLAEKSILEPFTQTHFVRLNEDDSVGSGLYRALQYSVQHWQHNDACLREKPSVRAIAGIADGMRLCRVVLQQLGKLNVDVSDDVTRLEQLLGQLSWLHRYEGFAELTAEDGAYHRALEEHPKLYEQVKEQQEHAAQLELMMMLSERDDYQLTLLELGELCQRQPQPAEADAMTQKLKPWATERLREDWQEVMAPFDRDAGLRAEHYLKLLPALNGSLQLGYCVGYLFDAAAREKFRAPWLDLARGIREITALKMLRETIKDSDESSVEKLLGWQEMQLESLLFALESSRRAALKQEPYWIA